MDKHDLVSLLKQASSDIGHKPTRDEFIRHAGISKHKVDKAFGTYTELCKAAFSNKENLAKAMKFKFKPTKISGFNIHEINIQELFNKHGNPDVLKCIVQPDTHGEDHDPIAFSCFLSFIKFYAPNILINLGDFINGGGITHWEPNNFKPKRLMPEIKICRELLWATNQHLPESCDKYFICGNHEDWLRQALVAKLPELFDGIDEYGLMPTVEGLLDLDGHGYSVIPLNHILRLGKAMFTHGLYTGPGHAKKHLDVFRHNIYYGHLHDRQSYSVTSIDGPIEAASLGCLSKLDAEFLRGKPSNWSHSFGIFEFFPDGTYTFMMPRILNGRMSYNGCVFT